MIARASIELLADLEVAVDNGPLDRRARMLSQAVILLVAGVDLFNEEQIELFDAVFLRLVERIDPSKLAPVRFGPGCSPTASTGATDRAFATAEAK